MKTKFLIFTLLAISYQISYSQMVVSDPGATAQIGVTNTKLTLLNTSIQKLNVSLQEQNRLLKQMLNTLDKMNGRLESIENMDTELINSKKTAPTYVQNSGEVSDLMFTKEKAVRTFKSIKKSVESLKHLNSGEIRKFIKIYAENMDKVMGYFQNSQNVLTTNSIIEPEERLKIIKRNTTAIDGVIQNVVNYAAALEKISQGRATSNSINSF